MAFENREQFIQAIQDRIGEDTSDEALQFVKDMTETFDNFSKPQGETVPKSDYDKLLGEKEELDSNWRKKYRDTFYSGGVKEPQKTNEPDFVPPPMPPAEPNVPEGVNPDITIDDLFNK